MKNSEYVLYPSLIFRNGQKRTSRQCMFCERWLSVRQTNQKNMKTLVNRAVTFVEEMQRQFNSTDPSVIKQPKSLKGTLLPYQLQGVSWMMRLFENGSHGMLADEMGLGKTIQVISLLACLREAGVWGPVLIIAPLSTLGNWVNEFAKWLPSVEVVKYHGTKEERKQLRAQLHKEETKRGVFLFWGHIILGRWRMRCS